MAVVRLVHGLTISNEQMTDLVVFPAYLAVKPEGISPAQTRPGGIEVGLEDVGRRHIRHPASLGRQLVRGQGTRPETCEDGNGSECTEHHAQNVMYHTIGAFAHDQSTAGGCWQMIRKLSEDSSAVSNQSSAPQTTFEGGFRLSTLHSKLTQGGLKRSPASEDPDL